MASFLLSTGVMIAGLTLSLLITTSVGAQPRVGLVLIGNQTPAQRKAVQITQKQVMPLVPASSLYMGPKLRRAFGANPVDAVTACGWRVKCLSGLGRKASLDRLLVADFRSKGRGLKVRTLLVDVEKVRAIHQESMVVSKQRVRLALRNVTRLLAVSAVGELELVPIAKATPQEVAAAPKTKQPQKERPSRGIPPGRLEPGPQDEEQDVQMQAPNAVALTSPSELPPKTAENNSIEEAMFRPNASSLSDESSILAPHGTISVAGLSIAGLGAVALAAGGYFEWKVRQGKESVTPEMPQLSTKQKRRELRDYARKSNALYTGGLIGMGAGILTYALGQVLDAPASVSTTVAPGGASVGLEVTW